MDLRRRPQLEVSIWKLSCIRRGCVKSGDLIRSLRNVIQERWHWLGVGRWRGMGGDERESWCGSVNQEFDF